MHDPTASKNTQVPRTQPLIASLSPDTSNVSAVPSASASNIHLQQGSSGGGVASLDAIVGSVLAPAAPSVNPNLGPDDTNEEDLFALPMSPRSPEMKRSPFSIL